MLPVYEVLRYCLGTRFLGTAQVGWVWPAYKTVAVCSPPRWIMRLVYSTQEKEYSLGISQHCSYLNHCDDMAGVQQVKHLSGADLVPDLHPKH